MTTKREEVQEGPWTQHEWITDPRWQKDRTRVVRSLRRLPRVEADMVRLFYFDRLSQASIAALFDCKQPSVNYRLSRACDRLRYLLALPTRATAGRMVACLGPHMNPRDVELVKTMWVTTCQTETGKRLGISQRAVCARFHLAVKNLRAWVDAEGTPRAAAFVAALERIRDQPNILTADTARGLEL